MASNTFPTNQAQLGWFLMPKTNLEWDKWWAEVESSSSYASAPEANASAFPISTTYNPHTDFNTFPVSSPESTNTSERLQNHGQTSDQAEAMNRTQRRKLQNREAQRKCRDRRREQVLNLGERLRNSMAENKTLQEKYAKLHEEYNRLKSENGVYFELLQSFWSSDMARKEPAPHGDSGSDAAWDRNGQYGRL